MLFKDQPCPVCENNLLPLHAEGDESDIIFMCMNLACTSRDLDGSMAVWDSDDLDSLRKAKREHGSLTKNGQTL